MGTFAVKQRQTVIISEVRLQPHRQLLAALLALLTASPLVAAAAGRILGGSTLRARGKPASLHSAVALACLSTLNARSVRAGHLLGLVGHVDR
jgi:hypothetical protein